MRKIIFFGKGFSCIVVGVLICSELGLISIQTQATMNNSYDLIIITPTAFSNELQLLVAHKEQHAIATKIVTLDDIYGGAYFPAEGRDDAEKIKFFIKNALDEWHIIYVLLVGGRKYGATETWYVPVRYVEVEWADKRYLSDLYFADIYDSSTLFQSWDTNEDDIFGTPKDIMDLNPDVYVGRWACRNIFEVRTLVQKTISYETMTNDPKKIVLIGGDTDGSANDADEGEVITTTSASYLSGYDVVKVYASETKVSSKNIRQALGAGASFMHFSGHGFVIYWVTYEHGEAYINAEPGLGIWDMTLFSNTQYPIVVFGGCHTSMFNVALIYRAYFWAPDYDLPFILRVYPGIECLGWFFNQKNGGGSVASLGFTNFATLATGNHSDKDKDEIAEPDCVEEFSGYIETQFFYAYSKANITMLGQCWGYAEDTYLKLFDYSKTKDNCDLRTVQSFVLLGDPSLKIGGYI